MALPAITFTIPSLHDQVELECRVYRPPPPPPPRRSSRADEEARILGAVIAHPYANLGGCFDDPAVLAATSELLEQGYTVGTFNFRGAGNSQGSTSWTGLPELADYVSFVGFLVTFLRDLHSTTSISLIPESDTSEHHDPTRRLPEVSLILAGYSYGSRILAHIPSVSSIVRRFTQPAAGSVEAAIADVARTVAEREKANEVADEPSNDEPSSPRRSASGEHSVHVAGREDVSAGSPTRHSTGSRSSRFLHMHSHRRHRSSTSSISHASPPPPPTTSTADRSAAIDLRFLLISPVLPPAGWLTSPRLHRPIPSKSGGGGDGDHSQQPQPPPVSVRVAAADMDIRDCWWDYPALVVYGDEDQFTSAAKVRRWLADMRRSDAHEDTSPAHIRRVEMPAQGHFWHSGQVQDMLREVIRRWVREVPEGRRLL